MTDQLARFAELMARRTAGEWRYSTCYGMATIEDSARQPIAHAVEYLKTSDADSICAAVNLSGAFVRVAQISAYIDNNIENWAFTHTGRGELVEARNELTEALADLDKAIEGELK